MNNHSLTSDYLTNIASVERAQSNIIYPAGTIYVQVSACRKNTDEIWNILQKAGSLEGKYAIVIPEIFLIPEYFVIALERVTAEWQARYIGSNINISMDLFRFLKVYYHADVKEQVECLECLQPVIDEIATIEREIELNQQTKQWFLRKMFL